MKMKRIDRNLSISIFTRKVKFGSMVIKIHIFGSHLFFQTLISHMKN